MRCAFYSYPLANPRLWDALPSRFAHYTSFGYSNPKNPRHHDGFSVASSLAGTLPLLTPGIGGGLSLYTSTPYSPSCREFVFSETHIQPVASLCVRTGGERGYYHAIHTTPPQHLVGPHKYP